MKGGENMLSFYNAEEVARILGVSKSHAYKLIREMNNELAAKGYITISGRISKQYFNERFYGTGKEECEDVGI